ncbi:MAG TPA: hypothetical protein VJX67_19635 [Blastocatellia bacterium]|nr:hypothetical protein [Blastocatellia bacterium]
MKRITAVTLVTLLLGFISSISTFGAPVREPGSARPVVETNISGAWVFEVETEQGSGSPEFTFQQDGEKLTGTYKGIFGEAALAGTVNGDSISFSVKVNAQGQDLVETYTGTIGQDSMKGTVKIGDLASGTWTAKRQEQKK